MKPDRRTQTGLCTPPSLCGSLHCSQVVTGYGFDPKAGREFPCDKDGKEVAKAEIERRLIEWEGSGMIPRDYCTRKSLGHHSRRQLHALIANLKINPIITALLTPAPRQKLPEISPIFKADTVRLHVSREKDGKLRLICSGWDDTKIVQPDRCGQARGAGRVDPTPWQGRAMTPPSKTRPPLRHPLVFPARVRRSRIFRPGF
jgi:hypothetical protein